MLILRLIIHVKPKGWDGTVVNGDNRFTGNGQQVDGNAQGYYLDSWNATPGTLLYNMHQTIESVPNGVYRLTAMTRTTSDKGVYLYAFADNDSSTVTLSQVELEKMNITELGGPSAADGGDSIATVTDTYGSIFTREPMVVKLLQMQRMILSWPTTVGEADGITLLWI